jgi:hypothetical protein
MVYGEYTQKILTRRQTSRYGYSSSPCILNTGVSSVETRNYSPVSLRPEVLALHIGNRIRQHRQAAGFSLRDVVDRLRYKWETLDQSWLSKIERGLYPLTFDQYVLICWAIGADPGELAKGMTPPD